MASLTPRSPLSPSSSSSFSRFSPAASRDSLLHHSILDSNAPTSAGMKPDSPSSSSHPMFCGVPLKYISLLTLAIQNAALSIVMHYSRVSTPASQAYSPAAAVLLNEVLKGTISFIAAFARTSSSPKRLTIGLAPEPLSFSARLRLLFAEIFAPDCFKLSIPAILYVIQNSLQFVAISNLPVASFQVAYQMKILTTAAFSVALLGKRLSKTKWIALLLLALGVGIVQIQTTTGNSTTVPKAVGSAAAAAPKHIHVMFPVKGFSAVIAACFTSGLAGVYFEMVLKNSKADLWVRNVQLSFFSLLPALLPILFSARPASSSSLSSSSHGIFGDLFKNFGIWAWATVAIQVFGGLVTAIVIKYSDNILKGFATSLSIILSFLASVVLFDFHITSGFLLGASTVLAATCMYNQPAGNGNSAVNSSDPILGEKPSMRHPLLVGSSLSSSSTSLSSLFGIGGTPEKERLARERDEEAAFLSVASRSASTSQFSVGSSVSPYVSRSPSPFVPPSENSGTTINSSSITTTTTGTTARSMTNTRL
ncbi:udp-galactose transporter [Pyrrhoderma noxium]|uniref:Udp-galactose transporter n=1 Tax=Pyrrhoderma noxium TaxID=2282107 RepID=A0A286UW48_9AGAM|nr:udp-galactose transporter [Pyrrhoderma noxium]